MQEEVVQALMRPEAYDEKVYSVKLLQTHISFVFLADGFAYKVKKPVNFGFLDFTTLEKRKFYCEEEARINSQLCSKLYLGVVPVRKSKAGEIKINGSGEVVEYAVKMRRLPQETIMTRLLEKNEVAHEEVARIALLLAKFHSKAKTGKGVDEYGSEAQIRANWMQNFEQMRNLRGKLIPEKQFDFIESKVLSFIDSNKKLFEERIAQKRVRECHGDVHSGNIFIVKSESSSDICIFDAIEFNKAFSCSDVAAEVAFLAMDLEFHGKRELAEHFVNSYVKQSGDRKLLQLLPFYKCYRAYVRAKVNSFKLADKNISAQEKKWAEKLTKKYFALAHAYAALI